MEEIDIKSLLRHILSKFYIILACLVLALGIGEFYTFKLQTPLYKSTTELVLLNDNSSSDQQLTVSDLQISNNLVTTYSEIVKSNNVLDQVISKLNLNYDANTLKSKLTVTTTTGTQLISVSVSDKNPETAQEIAQALATTFKKEIIDIYNIDNVQIVDRANLPTSPYNISILKQTLYYAIGGIALGLGITIAMFYLDTTIKDQNTIEDKLGLAVIGTIPDMEKK